MNAALQEVSTGFQLPTSEVYKLAAVDNRFYCKHFFPKAFRQDGPLFEQDFWEKFEDSDHDFFAAEIFREGGKTTRSRAGISKRIAYAISRNILAVAISETMAEHTVRWIRKQVENNTLWTETFGLRRGNKWTDSWLEVISIPFDCTINVIAMGITGGFRGLNLDDYRPDFIYCDDICNEENTGTDDQRNKLNDSLFGALIPSLAAKSEAPRRKFVLTNTGFHPDDPVYRAHKDPTFLTAKYPKLVETEHGLQSSWPARFPTEEALKEKEDYTRRGQTHVYLREFGCKIISRETSPLQAEWLRPYTVLPTSLKWFVGLDPATDSDKKNAHRTAIGVVGVDERTGDVYITQGLAQRGKNPDEMWIWLLDIYKTLRPRKVGCETIAFQKVLAWYFEKKMQEAKIFFSITKVEDRRSKPDRIIQAFSGLGSQGKLWVNPNMLDFISSWSEWTEKVDWDLGDAVAQAIVLANPWMARGDEDVIEGEVDYEVDERDIPDIVYEGGAP